MKLSRNLIAGLLGSIWSAGLGLAVVPVYLKYLGIEAYGLIGFYATTQALFTLLDLGLAPTINREVARRSADGVFTEAKILLHSLAVICWSVAGFIALAMLVLGPWIASSWLQSKALSQESVAHAVILMGFVIASRWPISLYQGVLLGLQRQTISSALNAAMSTVSSLGAVLILALVSPTIEAFFTWQCVVGLVFVAAIRYTAWRELGGKGPVRFNRSAVKAVWQFSLSMIGLTLAGLVFTQLDKLILSKMLTLEAFGKYALSGVVAAGLYVIITPFYSALYPRFSAIVAKGADDEVLHLYKLSSQLLSTIIFPVAMVLAVFGKDVVQLWTGNPELAASVSPLVLLLASGTALHGVTYIPYALQLSRGETFVPLVSNILLLLMMPALTVYLAISYGAIGGACAWFVLQVLYLLLVTWLNGRYVLKEGGASWLFKDIGIPFAMSVVAGVIGKGIIQTGGWLPMGNLALGLFLAVGAMVGSALLSPELVSQVRRVIRSSVAR